MSSLNPKLRADLINLALDFEEYVQDIPPKEYAKQASDVYRQIIALYGGLELLLHAIYDTDQDEPLVCLGLIFALGATEYGTPGEAVVYYAEMAKLARQHPELFLEVKSISERTLFQSRAVALETQWTDITLGCLLIGPTSVHDQISLALLLRNMDCFTKYVEMATELAPQRLNGMVKVARDGLVCNDLDVTDPQQLRLRRLIFDGQLIDLEECSKRLQSISHALHGARSQYTPQNFRNDLEAIALHPEYLGHAFLHDLYRTVAHFDDEYSLRDPCEERFDGLPQSTLNENIKTLQSFMLKHGMDYRMKLAAWVMNRPMGACLELKQASAHGDLWLEHAVVATLERHLDTDSKSGNRLLSWLSTLSEQHCLAISASEKQLMLCFQATGHSGLIQQVLSERYREEILSTDLGL